VPLGETVTALAEILLADRQIVIGIGAEKLRSELRRCRKAAEQPGRFLFTRRRVDRTGGVVVGGLVAGRLGAGKRGDAAGELLWLDSSPRPSYPK